MSRKARELRLEAEARWPNLHQFLASYLHEDWGIHSGTPEKAVEQAIADWNLAGRQRVLKEWREWNNVRGWKQDMRAALGDGLGVNVYFKTDEDARVFMNQVYEKLIRSVRDETSKEWTA